MMRHKMRRDRNYFHIEVLPVFEEADFYYKVIVCEYSKEPECIGVRVVRDIMHVNTLEIACDILAEVSRSPDGYREFD